jgi:hypothetical protein
MMGAVFGGILFTGGYRSPPDLNRTGLNVAELDYTRRYNRVRVGCVVLAVTLWVVALLVLFIAIEQHMNVPGKQFSGGADNWCSMCGRFQCAETSAWACKPQSAFYH